MGWATYLTTDIKFNRQTYNSLYEVEEAIDEVREQIKFVKENLLMIAATTDMKSLCENDEDPIYATRSRVNDLLESYEEATIDLYKLELLKEAWADSHEPSTGLAIDRKVILDGEETGHYNYLKHPLVSGDFIKSTHDEEHEEKEEDIELDEGEDDKLKL